MRKVNVSTDDLLKQWVNLTLILTMRLSAEFGVSRETAMKGLFSQMKKTDTEFRKKKVLKIE
jgi:hypothetical protein